MRAWLVVLAACGAAAHPTGDVAPARTDVHVDRRVELISIVARLAGYDEYNAAPLTPYVREVDAQFAPFKDHPAVVAMRGLRETNEMSHDAPMGLAMHLDDGLEVRDVADLVAVTPRWDGVDIPGFTAKLRDLAQASGFDEFFAAHAQYFTTVASALRDVVDAEQPVAWFDATFGKAKSRYAIVPALLVGQWNYGTRATGADGVMTMSQIMGVWKPDGMPDTDADTVQILIHEMAHSYINPIFDRHEAELAPPGKVILPLVARRMLKFGYADWQTVVRESAVRATVVQYFRDRKTATEAARELRTETKWGFRWTAELVDVMARIPPRGLEAHIGEVVALFERVVASYAHGLPQVPFDGPVDGAVLGDPVFVADPDYTAVVTAFRDSVYPDAPVVAAGADVLAAHPGKDLVVYGAASDPMIAEVLARAGARVDAAGVAIAGQQFDGPRLVLMVCVPRPDDKFHGIAVYTAADARDIGDLALWHGITDWYVVRRTDTGYEHVKGDDFEPPP